MSTRLIVLSGVAGAGKDSVARQLMTAHGWESYSLAGPMKRFAADMFGFSDDQLYGASKFRNEPDPKWARPCRSCAGTGTFQDDHPNEWDVLPEPVPCSACEGAGSINDNSPRRILQLMGEEFLRQMVHPDALTIRAKHDLERMLAEGRSIVVNDARNPNDRNNLHDWLGAHRVDVRTKRVKPITKESEWRLHVSEQRPARDDEVEYVIQQGDERWPFPTMPTKVIDMLSSLCLLH